MRDLRLSIIAATVLAACSCTGSPSRPSSAAGETGTPAVSPPGPPTICPAIGFDDLQGQGAPFTTYTACGMTLTANTSNWTISTNYGKPRPFILFTAAAGTTATGEIAVTAAGSTFNFRSVDLYSSTTPIPYTITGLSGSTIVFTIQGTHGNTFGNFATVVNPQQTIAIDTLVIRLSNPAAPCCANPMGVDNIVLTR